MCTGKEEQRILQNAPVQKYLFGSSMVCAPLPCKLLQINRHQCQQISRVYWGGWGVNKNLMLWLAEADTNKSNKYSVCSLAAVGNVSVSLESVCLMLCLFYCKGSREEGGAHLWLVLLLTLCQWK